MTPEQAVFASILICIAGAVLTLLTARDRTLAGWLAFLATAATAALIFSAVAHVLAGGASPAPNVLQPCRPFGFALRLHVDGLTAMFLMLAALIAVPASFYSIAYMRHYRGLQRGPLLSLFPAVPGGDVRPAQHHGHDVVLLHFLADDDSARLRAHPF